MATPENFELRMGQAFRVTVYTSPESPWYKRLQLWKAASKLKDAFRSKRAQEQHAAGGVVQDEQLAWMKEVQEQRRDAQKAVLPLGKSQELPHGLAYYERNLEQIIEHVRKSGSEPIFMAQAIQGDAMNEGERKRLWMGAMDGGRTFVRETEMLELLAAYNGRMREVAVTHGVQFIDLPSALANKPKTFYDGCHFNELGCRLAARYVADELKGTLVEKAKPR